MKPASTTTLLACIAAVSSTPLEMKKKALPPGHPIINDGFITQYNYTLNNNVYPTGFQIPTEVLTNIPHGYSIGPTAVWGPDGAVVTAFPSEVLASVAVQETTSIASPTSLSTSVVASTPAASTSASASAAFRAEAPAAVLAAAVVVAFSLL
ncbi:SubName: Full=Uncharacterized protein {ECO:0000313/EMBL:CCA71956.1} [Serendipita indica DSM 11827]|uniref:Uncharacterized protein n=1 Tax=Serendipita indica (strain DSM 11827) TaxID=1109443 RepID=G4TKW3_SERID|nr:SubName: Full=Uncharacterized protein {ECO:0000313/EMBL:CCA71956.1} [Serendipita indica DSM 11827]CCA71956.1 hypothetical protein PIIN_05891 [Serendipita indica DSM 11827]